MRYAIIVNGFVCSIAEANSALGEEWVASDTAVIGDKYDGASFTAVPIDWDIKIAEIKKHRNNLLASTDWTQISDCTVDKVAWASYRKKLRDMPAQLNFPKSFTWPISP